MSTLELPLGNYGSSDKWVYAFMDDTCDRKDVATEHAPVLDWQSGMENLEQLHQEPVQKKEDCGCDGNGVAISPEFASEVESVRKFLERMLLVECASHLGEFVKSGRSSHYWYAVSLLEEMDPVSAHQLRRIAAKERLIRTV